MRSESIEHFSQLICWIQLSSFISLLLFERWKVYINCTKKSPDWCIFPFEFMWWTNFIVRAMNNWNILNNIFFWTEILFDPCWAVSTGRWLTYFLINPKSVSLPASRDSSNNKIFRPRLRDSVHVVSVSWLLRSVIMFKFCGSCWNLFNYKHPWLTGVLQLSVVLYKLSAQVKIFLCNSHSDFN